MSKYREEIDILKIDILNCKAKLLELRSLPERNPNGFRDLKRANSMARESRKLGKLSRSMNHYIKIIMNN